MSKGTLVLVGALLLLGVGVWWWLRVARASHGKHAPQSARTEPLGDLPRAYSPQNVGNDASARPWEASAFGESAVAEPTAALAELAARAGFDIGSFLHTSKDNFIRLQAAWDRADIPALRALMTDDMIGQIQDQLSAREVQGAQAVSQTEVVMLEAKLLGIETLPSEYLASVEFSGMIREEPGTTPNPFREVWNITRPLAGPGGWLVAGVQALQ